MDATIMAREEPTGEGQVLVEHHVPIPMSDGTVLRASVYRPRAPGSYPVLVERTPYDLATRVESDALSFARHGYAFVAQHVRGRFASAGRARPWRDDGWGQHRDGYDTVAWAAAQPWSDGDVGMSGGSYSGYTQYLAAPTRPPHLKAMCVRQGLTDAHRDLVYPGGAHSLHTLRLWALRSMLIPEHKHPSGRSRPGADIARLEEALAKLERLCRQLPLTSCPPLEEGGADWYFEWLDHPEHDSYWAALDVESRLGEIDTPILHLGGWFDPFLDATLRCFAGVRARGRSETCRRGQRLLVGPWIHWAPDVSHRHVGALDFGEAADLDFGAVQRRWFDHWLKGVDAGEREEPPIRIFLMGVDRWLDLADWPPPGVTERPLYFRGGAGATAESLNSGRLTFAPPDDGEPPDAFVYDPSDPVPSLLVYPQLGPTDHRSVEGRMLTYTSDPLERDLTVVGPLKAVLHGQSSAPDTDWVVRLCDVWPDGRSLSLRDGILRSRYRASFEHPEPMTPGQVYRFELDLGATAQVFKAGHRLRVEVTSSDFPRYDRNLNTGGPIGTETRGHAAVNTVLHDAMRASYLVLPVLD
jgi:uncharacterized protein